MARLPVLVVALGAALAAAASSAEPAEIGGRDAAGWRAEASPHAAEVERLAAALAACEEREAPPAYRNVAGQVFRGRDGLRYREIVRCGALRDEREAAEAAAEEFEDGARREGVPPGWLGE